MPDRTFRSADGRYGLRLPAAALERVLHLCSAALPNETGGIIVGHYSSDRALAVVSEISGPPSDSRAGRTWFHRGRRGLRAWLKRLWSSNSHYLGEWHFHPLAAPDPSGTDVNQIRSIAINRDYHCVVPVLLIVGGDPGGRWTARAFISMSGADLVELKERIKN